MSYEYLQQVPHLHEALLWVIKKDHYLSHMAEAQISEEVYRIAEQIRHARPIYTSQEEPTDEPL